MTQGDYAGAAAGDGGLVPPGEVVVDPRTVFGHPTGLYTLFFAEMWERFSYYGMRALLVFYMLKGFLAYDDARAYSVYGAYTALVYMTPFIGGMLADRLLGARRAVIIGGILMASGHLAMTIETASAFYFALALLIVGNGFFKPNISSIVGELYTKDISKRDAGFTIFYMGINLGAAMSPLLCGYIGQTYGWHYGFGLATIGMLIGLAVFVMPTMVTKALILFGAVLAAVGLVVFRPENPMAVAVNWVVAAALLAAAVVALVALGRGGLPASAGRPAHWQPGTPESFTRRSDWMVYLAVALSIPVFAAFVSGFSIFTADGRPVQIVPQATIESFAMSDSALMRSLAIPVDEVSKPAGLILTLTGLLAFGYLLIETFRCDLVSRQRMFVVFVLTFFSMLFWAFFEQAGSSINNFTDRNVDRVRDREVVSADSVGTTLTIQPTQAQLGYPLDGRPFTLTQLDRLRAEHADPNFTIAWPVTEAHIGMGIANRTDELPASIFQAANPIYILIFGLIFSALWTYSAQRGWEPSTPTKFALGLLQLGLGFAALWIGVQYASSRGMVALPWLLLGYLLHTTGELCLSPVGLAMVVKLSPARLVSTVMGSWFLATAFSQYLAAIISQFTGISHGDEGEVGGIPAPIETVTIYGDVFGSIGIAALVSGLICLALAPLLRRWMHEEAGAI